MVEHSLRSAQIRPETVENSEYERHKLLKIEIDWQIIMQNPQALILYRRGSIGQAQRLGRPFRK
jgi:hypothetical protein